VGSETQRPIAVVIVGGTLSAALLTLVVLPVMYDLVSRLAERVTGRNGDLRSNVLSFRQRQAR
jgi:cobalt-zinc-cadmium resistance protein CzcA